MLAWLVDVVDDAEEGAVAVALVGECFCGSSLGGGCGALAEEGLCDDFFVDEEAVERVECGAFDGDDAGACAVDEPEGEEAVLFAEFEVVGVGDGDAVFEFGCADGGRVGWR